MLVNHVLNKTKREKVGHRRTLRAVVGQAERNELLEVFICRVIVRDGCKFAFDNLQNAGALIAGFERVLESQTLIENDAQGPNVRFIIVRFVLAQLQTEARENRTWEVVC